jgi:hypothetical protein
MRISVCRVAFLVGSAVAIPIVACGTPAIGTDVCTQIESARCTRLGELANSSSGPCDYPDSSIPVDLLAPFGDGSTGSPQNVSACIQYYSVACLHGIYAAQPSTIQVSNCVNAIADGGSCGVVMDPAGNAASSGSCYWLLEAGPDGDGAPPPVDAGCDAATPFGCTPLDTGVPIDTGFPDVKDFEACPEGGCLTSP